jgi:hypothetical protein
MVFLLPTFNISLLQHLYLQHDQHSFQLPEAKSDPGPPVSFHQQKRDSTADNRSECIRAIRGCLVLFQKSFRIGLSDYFYAMDLSSCNFLVYHAFHGL